MVIYKKVIFVLLIFSFYFLKGSAQDEKAWVRNDSKPHNVTNGLNGRHISLWASHGRYYDAKKGVWKWQRPCLYGTTEDLFSQTFVVPFLIPMLENAGAYVYTPRERDWQRQEVIVDNGNGENIEGKGKGKSIFGYFEENGEQAWTTAPRRGFAPTNIPYKDFDRPFSSGTARIVATTQRGEATTAYYRPRIQKSGDYAVYISYQTVEGSVDDAEYTVVHGGRKTRFLVNQRMGSGTWVYLGTFHFEKGFPTENCVIVRNKSAKKGFVTTDAVKFGGGMGNHLCAGMTSGLPRAMEGARYWAQYSGAPLAAVYCKNGRDDYGEDLNVRSLMSNWLSYGSSTNPSVECDDKTLMQLLDSLTFADAMGRSYAEKMYNLKSDSLLRLSLDSLSLAKIDSLTDADIEKRARFISDSITGKQFNEINVCRGKVMTGGVPFDLAMGFHTDAGFHEDLTSVWGALTICTTDFNNMKTAAGTTRQKSFDLACNLLHNLQQELSIYAPQWTTREVWDRNYSESRLPAQESALLEMLSHESFPDMKLGHDPVFKFLLSRTVYKTILRHFAKKAGRKTVVQPLPPKDFSAGMLQGNVLTLSWNARHDKLEASAKPSSYNIYVKIGDGDYDNGTNVKTNEYSLPLEEGKVYRFRITAVNAGGESFPTEELVAYYNSAAKKKALVINAFHRLAPPYVVETDSTCGFDLKKDIGLSYGKTIAWVGEQVNFNKKEAGRMPGLGSTDNSLLGRFFAGNDFNYCYPHAKALAETGEFSVVSISSDCCGHEIETKGLSLVDIVFGNEKDDGYSLRRGKTFSKDMRKTVEGILERECPLIVSGSYITSDMSAPEEEEWLAKHLKIKHCGVSCDSLPFRAGNMSDLVTVGGKTIPVFRHVNEDHYASVSSDVIMPAENCISSPENCITPSGNCISSSKNNDVKKHEGYTIIERIIAYHTGETAALSVAFNKKRLVALGFPFECIKEEKDRTMVMKFLLKKLDN